MLPSFKHVLLPTKTFVFVRHGSTDWTFSSVDQGPQNLTLNKKGLQEAENIAKFLIYADLPTDCRSYTIISSTLQRASETAKIIAHTMKAPLLMHQQLEERYFGDFRLLQKDATARIPPDAEKEEAFKERIRCCITSLLSAENVKNSMIILVSHGEVFKYLSTLLTGTQQTIPHGGVCFFIPPKQEKEPWSTHIVYPEPSAP